MKIDEQSLPVERVQLDKYHSAKSRHRIGLSVGVPTALGEASS
ncbi:hypothetical protein [Mycolicibacterium peregrinum]|nr:hypothetical protein [Mycolicibacterium peregrinum]